MVKKRVALLDTSCVAFQLEVIADKQDDPWSSLVKLIDLYDQNGGLILRDDTEEVATIWCFDSKAEFAWGKGYWRHDSLRNIGIEYKPGRSDNRGISVIKQAIANRVPISRQARQIGFEADDIIACLVEQYSSDYLVDIVTVDSDLLQLVSDRVRWVNTAHYTPIIRGVSETKAYALRRWNTVITLPKEIIDIKVAQGDRSDGLPPGTPRGYIDLKNPLVRCPYWHTEPLEFRPPVANQTGIYYESAHCPILHPENEPVFILGGS